MLEGRKKKKSCQRDSEQHKLEYLQLSGSETSAEGEIKNVTDPTAAAAFTVSESVVGCLSSTIKAQSENDSAGIVLHAQYLTFCRS